MQAVLDCSGLRREEGGDLRLEGREGSMLQACQPQPSEVGMLLSDTHAIVCGDEGGV